MNNIILLHEALIEIIILILIVIIYYSKSIPDKYLSICLLGSYILLRSIFNFIHFGYHKYFDKK
jgi:hypothetical protein